MRETTTSHRDRVHPWLVSLLLLLALVVGGAGGALLMQARQPSPVAVGPTCPSSASNVTRPSPPTQVVCYNPPSIAPTTLTLQPTQTLEIALYGPWTWQLRTQAVAPALTLETPAGYLDALGESCVWRFTAQQVGAVRLQFLGNRHLPGDLSNLCGGYLQPNCHCHRWRSGRPASRAGEPEALWRK